MTLCTPRVLALALPLLVAACKDNGPSGPGDDSSSGPPAWIMTAWIFQVAPGSVTVWDFRPTGGGSCSSSSCVMSAQSWLFQSALGGWQKTGLGSPTLFNFRVKGKTLTTTATITGTTTDYDIVESSSTQMTLYNTRTGTTTTLASCAAGGWPPLIYSSTAGCR